MVEHASRGDIDLFWIVGGNFLETLPDAARSRRALSRPRLRVHQDIVLSSSMLVKGEGDVLVLPAATRYESPGGGTETSTERRIIFSPEIPGRRIGSARPEWWVFREVMARAAPDRVRQVGMGDAAEIRRKSRAPSRSTRALTHFARRATRCSGAVRRFTQTGGLPRQTGRHISRRSRSGRSLLRAIDSMFRRGAASSSTRWCNAK